METYCKSAGMKQNQKSSVCIKVAVSFVGKTFLDELAAFKQSLTV